MNADVLLWGDLCIDNNIIDAKKVIGPGGAAFFGAQVFKQLGTQPLIVSPRGKDYTDAWLGNISVFPPEPSEKKTLIFENNYDPAGVRTLIAHNRNSAHFIDSAIVSSDLLQEAKTVIVCPVDNNVSLNNVQKLKDKISSGTFFACFPQGFFRSYNTKGIVGKQEWTDADKFMPYFDLLCLSEADGVNLDEKALEWSKLKPIVVITRAEKGCSVFVQGIRTDFPAFKVEKIVDPVGAGDVFAAGFIYSYLKHKDIKQAAVFANAAGALSLGFHATDMHIAVGAIEQMMLS